MVGIGRQKSRWGKLQRDTKIFKVQLGINLTIKFLSPNSIKHIFQIKPGIILTNQFLLPNHFYSSLFFINYQTNKPLFLISPFLWLFIFNFFFLLWEIILVSSAFSFSCPVIVFPFIGYWRNGERGSCSVYRWRYR